MASIEERIEDRTKQQLGEFGISYYTKTESINSDIDSALAKYPSKSGGSGKNYPDIKLFLTTETRRKIPVMIEVKGTKGRLEKLKNGAVENTTGKGEPHYKNINDYALNGAVHYANAILDYTHSYDEVIALGINGYEDASELKTQYAFYYLNRKNLSVPKKIGDFSDLSCFSKEHLESFITKLDSLSLDEKERENAIENLESDIESKLNALNQFLHDELLNINPNTRVALLVGMIMAAQGVKGKIAPLKVEELKCEQGANSNDGQIFLNKIKDFLCEKNLPQEKVAMVINDLESAFIHSKLHTPSSYAKDLLHTSDESPLKKTYQIVLDNILPLVKKLQTADIAGRLFNSITKWLEVPDNEKNDVVLTPRYVVDMMVSLAGVNKDSFVWDYATGSGAFLISAMNAMIKDAQNLQSPKEIEAKIAHIKAYQLLGIEKRSDIYLLGILNMILLDDGSANLLHKDSLKDFNGSYEQGDKKGQSFPADVFLLNPPYSASGKGFIFVERALRKMSKGRACVIIQENAGSGNGLPYTADILKHSTLLASIKMPSDLFAGKSSVQTAIYVFEVGKAHNVKQMVKFIDFSSDGYTRAARKKAKASTNLKDTDNAKARYEELINVVLYGSGYLHYYKDFYIEDTINLEGRDWTYSQHKKIDTTPTLADFKKCVSEYLAWEVSNVLKNQNSMQGGLEGNALSPRLAKLEKDFKQNGGKWREFKLGELFEVSSSKKIFHANQITIYNDEIPNSYPYVVRSTRNNGVRGYLCENRKYLNPANTLSFAQDTFSVFYQEKPYFTGNKVKVLTPKFKPFTKIHALFFASIYQKVLETFTWGVGSTEDDIKDIVISLPVLPKAESKGYEIAFDYMESYIKELEAERLQELEAYLKVTGLNDYTLSQKEQEALKAFENLSAQTRERERVSGISHEMPLKALQDSTLTDSREWQSFANTALSTLAQKELESSSAKNDIEWKSFKIGELFENIQQGARLKKEDHIQGDLPFVMAGITNNGICGFIGNDNARKFKANAITIDILGNVFYRDYDFGASDDVGVFWNEHKLFNKEIMLFICASIQKSLMGRFDFGNKLRASRAFDLPCLLPILDSNNIDFTFMESFIKAIEKQHIETLYRFWESKLKAYNAVINGGGVKFTLSEYEEFCKGLKAQDSQFKPYHSKSFLLETGFSPCHTEPLDEVSKAESNKDISLTKLAQYDKNHNIEWKSFKCEKLFSVKSNPQLNKDSFSFSENAPYPYFTRTCLNNGIAGYVEYLDEEHKIKGESIAVGMLGMQFFYMQKDFYAGQFTKTLYPKFSGLNATIAQFFITWLNKNQKIFQGVLVRDFEKTFNETEILLPVLPTACHTEPLGEVSQVESKRDFSLATQTQNDKNVESSATQDYQIAFDFIESFIKAVQKECIKSVVLWQEREARAYKQVVETLA